MGVFNKIAAGFTLGATSPVVAGIEDWLYLFNEEDFTLTFDPTNPLIVTGITAVGSAHLYKFTGTNNSFKASSKSVTTDVGPRFEEEIDWNVAGNDVATKNTVMAAGYGRVRAIVVNNFKDSDSYIELYGANNGMLCTFERSSDNAAEGGWLMKLIAPQKIKEPYPPRSIQIPPTGSGSPPATYASTLAAIEALVAA